MRSVSVGGWGWGSPPPGPTSVGSADPPAETVGLSLHPAKWEQRQLE